jgi:hypothetical protein
VDAIIILLLFISAELMGAVILVPTAKTVMAFLPLAVHSAETPSASRGAQVKIQFGAIRKAMSSQLKKLMPSTEKGTVRSAESSVLYYSSCSVGTVRPFRAAQTESQRK